MVKADCPNLNALQSLLDETGAEECKDFLGHLESCTRCQTLLETDEAGAEECKDFLGHLESCTRCQNALETLAGDTAAWGFTATGLGQPERYEAALLDLMDRLKDQDFVGADDDNFSFLQPADKAGLLGLLGDYEIQEQIGRGGMGVVFKATDPSLHRTVAIKVLTPGLAASVTARRRFVREGRAAAKVVHDNIVTVHGVQETDGVPYLIMQHVEGESLQERLDREGPLELLEIVRIAQQAAAGLAAAHAQGLIHRDIKPANLLLEAPRVVAPATVEVEERVKITDFGLARMADDIQVTQHGMVIGTPEYMSPEQARGEAVDHRSDLFSLGSVIYAMCADRPPFRGSSTVAVLRQVSDEEPVPMRSVNPDAPAWLAELVERLMRKNPDERYQQASEIAALLAGFLAQEREPHLLAPAAPPGRRQRRGRARSLAWLACALILAVAPVSLWFQHALFPAALQEDPAAQPGRAGADGKKGDPAGDPKKPNAPVQGPIPQKDVPATPEQKRAVEILKRLNAKFQFNAPGRPVVHVSFEPGTVVDDILEDLLPLTEIGVLGLQGTKITDAGLKHVAGFKKMFQLYLGQTAVTDAGLKELATLERLEHLGLENTQITDVGVNTIVKLKNLKYLNIGGTAVTDGCLKDVGGLPQLGMLCLYSTGVTDAGMKELKGLTSLRTLLLNDTALTDAGIKELAPLKQLKKINVQNTNITDAGLQALQEAVPAARAEVEPGAAPGGQPGRSHVWLTVAGVVAGIIALSVVGVVLVVRQRQKDGKTPASRQRLHPKTSAAATPLPVSLACPSCQRKLRAKAEHAGKTVKCPSCGSGVEVPSLEAGFRPAKPARPNG
jgi:Protein kinase domain